MGLVSDEAEFLEAQELYLPPPVTLQWIRMPGSWVWLSGGF